MDPAIQTHILDNLKELNTSVAKIGQGQEDICQRIDKIVPWVKEIDIKATDAKDTIKTIESKQSVLAWKLGTFSAGAGVAVTFCLQWIASKLGFKLH